MNQHPINLITPEIVERTCAGIRTGRFIFAAIALTVCMVLTATHSRIHLDGVEDRHETTSARAELALALDTSARALEAEHDELMEFMRDYNEVALPLDVTRIIATLVETLPESVTLTEFELDYEDGQRTSNPQPRHLAGTIAGVAATDGDVAALVHGLGLRPPFERVQLEYSRSRTLLDRSTREFSVSFEVDLQGRFQLVDVEGVHEGDHR
jgi:hypothetical protein